MEAVNFVSFTKGCAPPPGSYDIKTCDLKGAASFDKSDRFKLVKTGKFIPYIVSQEHVLRNFLLFNPMLADL